MPAHRRGVPGDRREGAFPQYRPRGNPRPRVRLCLARLRHRARGARALLTSLYEVAAGRHPPPRGRFGRPLGAISEG
ncbi:protein of unknown function [Streptomyces murinus]